MTAIAIILIAIWLFIIQTKLTQLSDTVQALKENFLTDKIRTKELPSNIEPANTPAVEKPEPPRASMEPESISDIPDECLFSNSAKTETHQSDSKIVKKEKQTSSFENIFLGNIFNKIGAVAILIGLVILIKIVSPYFVFTDELKTALGYLAGFAMMIGALKLNAKPNMRSFSEVLLGTGFGALFISTYCAGILFKFFDLPQTVIVASALLLAAFYLADKLKTVSMLVISLIAAYITPFLLNAEFETSSNFLFGYFIFINILTLLYTYRNKSRGITNNINLCVTFVSALILCGSDANILMPLVLWGVYVIYDLMTQTDTEKGCVLSYINLGVLTGLLLLIESDNNTYIHFGYINLAAAFIYAVFTYLNKSGEQEFKKYLNLSLAAAFLAVCFICDESPTTKCYVWAVEAVALAYYACKYKLKMLAIWTILIWAVAAFSIIPVDGVFAIKSIKDFTPVWNVRLLMFTPVILSSAASYYLLSKSDDKKFIDIAESFKFACITSIYFYMGLELNNIITQRFIGENTSPDFINNMTNSILGFAYTINLKRLNTVDSNCKPFISIVAAIAGIFSTIYLIVTGTRYFPVEAYIPVINIRCAAFLSGIAACIVFNRLTGKNLYKYLAIIFGFILMNYETADIISKYTLDSGLISVGWILYSGIITTIGIFKNTNWLKASGIVLCIISILRIFFHDLREVDILYKFIAILTLGVCLMILSYLYNKKSSK